MAESSPIDNLFWRDEVLQILYWLRGEGIGDAVAPGELVSLLGTEEEMVHRHLERLVQEGHVDRQEGARTRYRLTEQGMKEGGRRFADQFAGLTGQAHGECSDPNCVCRTLGPAACESSEDSRH